MTKKFKKHTLFKEFDQHMKKGICCAGNMIVDITYPIETWPNQNELTHITEGI